MSGPATESDEGGIDYSSQAKEIGWIEKEYFRGDESKWIDAKEYVERSENFLPIIKSQNKRMKEALLTRDTEISTLKQTLTDVQKSMGVMRKHYDDSVKQQVDQAKKDLINQIKAAREEGDVDLEVLLQDKLGDLRDAQKEAAKAEPEEPTKKDGVDKSTWSPEFVKWNDENKWFGNMEDAADRKRTKAMLRIGEDLREDGDTSSGTAFIEKCLDILEKQEAAKEGTTTQKRSPSKVESGSSGREARGGSNFASLPKEARDACHSDNDRFVGPGKLFKTVKEWEESFYNQYSSQD